MADIQGRSPKDARILTAGPATHEAMPCRVVVIGAGIGSLEPLQLFFAAMPVNRNLAFVICRQSDSETADHLGPLLRDETGMPVIHVEDGIKLEGNSIYLVPPNMRMIVLKDHLVSFDNDEDGLGVGPLDLLFHALAASAGWDAIAVLLSGAGDDGLRGAVSVKRAGGLVLAQDPVSADFPGRLNALIDAGLASAKKEPEALPGLIGHVVDGGQLRIADSRTDAGDLAALARIFHLLADRFHLDLEAFRRSMVARRIRRRAALSTSEDLVSYAAHLEGDDHEAEQLHDDLISGAAAFFRDPEAFSVLASKVLPALTQPFSTDRSMSEQIVKVWVPACATGEEAYSLAMLITDHLRETGWERKVEINATDHHLSSLEAARYGSYAPEQLISLPSALIERYMEPAGERLRVKDCIRDLVTFAQHDLIHDAPLSGVDLVSCRNLLIHLTPKARGQAFSTCCQSLAPAGILFLGPSELPGSWTEGLSVVDRHWRIYQRMPTRPSNPVSKFLPDLYRERPAETIPPPMIPRPAPFYPPVQSDADHDQPGLFDGLLEQNQQMLESTIDTLLASNDALRRRNRDLRLENQRLTTANSALEDVATMVAHDLKAPLRAVDHLARNLEARLERERERTGEGDDLRHLRLRLVGLNRLVDDLIAYARQDANNKIAVEEVELGDLIREVLVLIGLPSGFRLEVRPPILSVRTRRIPLECVLRNLLGHVIEHHGGKAGSIMIEVTEHDNALDVRITDDGEGVSDQSEGLGLAIVRQLLASEGAHLDIEPRPSAPGKETRFTWPIEEV